ncbi:ATP synthase F1 subunit gamma [Candidatus Kaiserbacteria bacterium CG10_big_fil_rev_8_21_14_0_10_45_20]|uniref:ATP synthase gamma chain n=1 Tax=Candidatus Kaiserbacteria bacterium CG10_big_fil_rev_8_21_14_0_10_45_20 TaxID=1974607 RepID=A0A2H0UIM4_9BACT|nr:MAG: ATP synthase F1 subunit gamma [Candidatus Kaiserbacteria bacterium CG10_big_fil_rev_8_21_14_0_10_45_20]
MSLKDIKVKIKSVNRTRKVTKAMEAVSAVKMRKSQIRALSGRPYVSSALSILERLSPSLKKVSHPLTQSREVSKAALVVVTSDKGLCGALNGAVLKEASKVAKNYALPKEDIQVYAFGKKAGEYFEREGYTLHQRFDNVSDEVSIEDYSHISESLVEGFMLGAFDRVDVVYTTFRSTFEQKAVSHQVLPLSMDSFQAMVKTFVSEDTFLTEREHYTPPAFYTVEPSPEGVLKTLIPKLVSVIVLHALLESKASEHSARMVAMKNASDKSRDLSKSLTRTFNKARQAVITREVSEIVGGIEAMAVD